MIKLQKILGVVIVGILVAGIANASLSRYWSTLDDFIPRTNDTSSIGSTTKRVKKVWTTDLDISGVLTLGGVSGGDLDMDGYDILNIGKAGFGEATPDATLEVVSDGGGDYLMISSVASADGDIFIVDSSGNVGIGTSSPDRKLDILDATNPQLRLTHTDGTVYADMQLDDSGDLYITPTGGSTAFGDGLAGDSVIDLFASTTRVWTFGLDDSDDDNFKLATSSDFSTGTILEVTTSGTITLWYSGGTDFTNFSVDTNGDLIITPSGGDTLFGDGLAGDSVIDLYASATRTWTFGLDDSDSDSFKISTSSDFASGNALTITTTGNIGINDTTPDAMLEITSSTAGGDLFMISDASDGDIMKVDSNGYITFIGVWKSDDLPVQAVKIPAANYPAEDDIDNFGFHRYDYTAEESTYYTWVVPMDFAEGTANVRGHFALVVENPPTSGGTNTAENVRMGFEYKRITEGAVFTFTSATSGTIDEVIAVDETALILHITLDGTLNTTDWVAHDKILFRFYRDATAAEDTYDNGVGVANDVWVKNYHLEYLSDKIGE